MTFLWINRLCHLFGFALFTGGLLSAFLGARLTAQGHEAKLLKEQWIRLSLHQMAGSGLVLLMIFGFWQSYLHGWSEFKGMGYMHAKLGLVALELFLLVLTMKQVKKSNWAGLKNLALAQLGILMVILWLIQAKAF